MVPVTANSARAPQDSLRPAAAAEQLPAETSNSQCKKATTGRAPPTTNATYGPVIDDGARSAPTAPPPPAPRIFVAIPQPRPITLLPDGRVIEASPITGFENTRGDAPVARNAPSAAGVSSSHYGEKTREEGPSKVESGRVYADAVRVPGGIVIDVTTRHNDFADDMVLYLQARPRSGDDEHIITLTVLHDGIINPVSYTARKQFFVTYDEINGYLRAQGVRTRITPNDPLAVQGAWRKTGTGTGWAHDSGGFARGAYFDFREMPEPDALTGHKVITGGAAVPQATTGPFNRDTELPLTRSANIPAEITARAPKVFAEHAKFETRMEQEAKFSVRHDDLAAATAKLYALSQDKAAGSAWVRALFDGEKGWSLAILERYVKRDAQGAPIVDARGLPAVEPMRDVYVDTLETDVGGSEDLGLTNLDAVLRFRDGEIKAGKTVGSVGKCNIKYGGGNFNPLNLIGDRIEASLDTRSGIMDDPEAVAQFLEYLRTADAPYDPLAQLQLISPLLRVESLAAFMKLSTDRYKFALKHESGVSLEISLDSVTATTTHERFQGADGAPQTVTFCQVEVEMDHKQFANAGDDAQDAYAAPVRISVFKTAAQQDSYFAGVRTTGVQPSFGGPPRLHEVDDLRNNTLRHNPSYALMEDAVTRLVGELFGSQIFPARQKCAQAAEMMGLVEKRTANVKVGAMPTWISISSYQPDVRTELRFSPRETWYDREEKPTVELLLEEITPLSVPLQGHESPEEVARLVAAALPDLYVTTIGQTDEHGRVTVEVTHKELIDENHES